MSAFTELNFDIDHWINRFVPRSRLHLLPRSISWLLGYRAKPTPKTGNVLVWWWAFIGSFCGILIVEAVFHSPGIRDHGTPIIIGSLGAAAILEYNTIDSPLAQPRSAIFGQLFSTIIGVGITKLFQLNSNFENLRWIAGALAVGLASAFMGVTKTIHPPAGATALLAATTPEITQLGWFLVPLIVLGSGLMIAVACVTNNIQRQFPMYWWTPLDLSLPTQGDIEEVDKEGKIAGESSRSGSFYTYENHRKNSILIENGHIYVPSWISLDPVEQNMLEIFRLKIEEGLRGTSSRETDDTHVDDNGNDHAPEIMQ